ncbi:MAG: hypothetical protein KBS52_05275 [Clostridiales bacterium]|nr:hypothetical protein [Candidatus Equinaster intestinalis]
MFSYKQENYKNYGKCIYMTNGTAEVVATLEKGPRIVRYALIGRDNILYDNAESFAPNSNPDFEKYYGTGKAFNIYGGHRLWLAKELYPETYYPDNDEINFEIIENGVILTPPPQTENGVQLGMKIVLDETGSGVTVEHTVKNIGDTAKECALWAITVSATNGTEIIPLNTNDAGFQANGKIAYWQYTDLRLENIYIGKKYATVLQPDADALKLGFDLKNGRVYYVTKDCVFTKSYTPNYPDGIYPDGGVSFETYSCSFYTELETLGELKKLSAGQTATHTEKWEIFDKPCDFDPKDENSIDEFLKKI